METFQYILSVIGKIINIREVAAETTEETRLAYLSAEEFSVYVVPALKEFIQSKVNHIKSYHFIYDFSLLEIEKILFYLQPKEFFAGQSIYKENGKIDGVHLIVSGTFSVQFNLL